MRALVIPALCLPILCVSVVAQASTPTYQSCLEQAVIKGHTPAQRLRGDFERLVVNPMKELVKLRSVDGDPDLQKTAELVQAQMAAIGMETQSVVIGEGAKASAPFIIGRVNRLKDGQADPKAKTVVIYGHYDVVKENVDGQFTVTEKDGRLYGRGVADDKYALASALAIVKVLNEFEGVPVNIVLVLEGEEEKGSPNFPAFWAQHGATIKPDVIMISDFLNRKAGSPSLVFSTKGGIKVQMRVDVSEASEHNGIFPSPDPRWIAFQQMSKLIADPMTMRVIPELQPPSTSERTLNFLRQLPVNDPDVYSRDARLVAGVRYGDPNSSPAIRMGVETVISSGAFVDDTLQKGLTSTTPHATLPMMVRLAPGVDGERARETIRRKLTENVPWNAKITLDISSATPPWSQSIDQFELNLGADVFGAQYGTPAIIHGEGGGMPLLLTLSDRGRIPVIGCGGSDSASNVHGATESIARTEMVNNALSILHYLIAVGTMSDAGITSIGGR